MQSIIFSTCLKTFQGVAKYVSKIAVEMVLRDISLKTALKHGLHIGCLVNCSKVDKTCQNEFVRFVELSSAKPVVYGPSTMQLTLDTSKGNKVHCEGLPEYFDIGSETRIPSSNEKPGKAFYYFPFISRRQHRGQILRLKLTNFLMK